MNTELSQQIDRLRTLPFPELQREHLIVFGKRNPSRDPQLVFRRLAWQLQATAEGGLSERARARAAELAPGHDLRLQAICTPPGPAADSAADGKDARLPQPGTVLVREFRGQRITVRILANGFDYDGCFYRSLSAIAEKATGTSWNGYQFFGLTRGARGGRDRS